MWAFALPLFGMKYNWMCSATHIEIYLKWIVSDSFLNWNKIRKVHSCDKNIKTGVKYVVIVFFKLNNRDRFCLISFSLCLIYCSNWQIEIGTKKYRFWCYLFIFFHRLRNNCRTIRHQILKRIVCSLWFCCCCWCCHVRNLTSLIKA